MLEIKFSDLTHQKTTCGIAILLCLCVVMQLLGAPITLMSASDANDVFSSSVLEGFAVPQRVLPLLIVSKFLPANEQIPLRYFLTLDSNQFHPPAC